MECVLRLFSNLFLCRFFVVYRAREPIIVEKMIIITMIIKFLFLNILFIYSLLLFYENDFFINILKVKNNFFLILNLFPDRNY